MNVKQLVLLLLQDYKDMGVTKIEERVLVEEVIKRTGCHRQTVYNVIHWLKVRGVIRVEGSGRNKFILL